MRYVALLRGINVGGHNIIKMVDLRRAFEAAGYSDVSTYIQSGNVVFTAPPSGAAKAKLTAAVESMLGEAFAYESRVVLLSAREMALVVEEAPPRFGADPARYRYDVLFVKPPLEPGEALAQVPTNPAVDVTTSGSHALYFRRLVAKATQSRLSRLAAQPVYKRLTIRNWNTTRKLAEMTAG
jgi:uncharacterized protein (DUF1697 family)